MQSQMESLTVQKPVAITEPLILEDLIIETLAREGADTGHNLLVDGGWSCA